MGYKRDKQGARRPKGRFQGRHIPDLQKEMAVQMYVLTGNKSEVARQLSISYPTLCKILKDAEGNKEMQAIRASAMEEMAGKVHGKTLDMLEAIGPEDLESGTIKTHDNEGKLVAVKTYGPSLLQKTTAAAIFMDKMKVIEETKRAIVQDSAEGGQLALPSPDNVQAALAAIGEKVKALRIIDVQFAEKSPELASKLQEAVVEAEYTELDFDNP